MIKKFLVLVFVLTLCAMRYALAQPISSSELINNAKQYDGQTVVFAGEVIGDVMVRGDYSWVNVNDGKSAIGIWLDTALTRNIFYTGSYKSRGDSVEVVGIFHRACVEHGGDLDIHALSLRKINSGRYLAQRLNLDKRNFAFILFGILCLLWILRVLKRK